MHKNDHTKVQTYNNAIIQYASHLADRIEKNKDLPITMVWLKKEAENVLAMAEKMDIQTSCNTLVNALTQ